MHHVGTMRFASARKAQVWAKRGKGKVQTRTKQVACKAAALPQCDLDDMLLPCSLVAENQLDALRKVSVVVADTGDIEQVKKYKPVDCTTNPSLMLKAASMPEYEHLLRSVLSTPEKYLPEERPMSGAIDLLSVEFGSELLKSVPGRVSTECDAHLSYNTQKTIDKGRKLIDLYAAKGIEPSRVYIKIASTWEGIKACEVLEKEGINCNMTLLFSMAQAMACADVGATLISPFVGRILDWYKKAYNREYESWEDPGVQSVKRIYKYYKLNGFKTIVMAASFRNVGEIREISGCDNITISPALLKELEDCTDPLEVKLLSADAANIQCDPEIPEYTELDSSTFNAMHSADQMATDKLAEGIESFSKDQEKLEALLQSMKGT